MSRDLLDAELRKLALAVTKAAIASAQAGGPKLDIQHERRVETLKVIGNFSAQGKRGKAAVLPPEEDDTMTAIQARIAAADKQEGGHA
jgi:hypothetical protein